MAMFYTRINGQLVPIVTNGSLIPTTTKVGNVIVAGADGSIADSDVSIDNVNSAIQNVSNIINGTTAAAKATKDGSGNTITSTYVNLSGAQTISGAKTFTSNAVMKTDTDYGTARARNTTIQNTVPTSIANGNIVEVYE